MAYLASRTTQTLFSAPMRQVEYSSAFNVGQKGQATSAQLHAEIAIRMDHLELTIWRHELRRNQFHLNHGIGVPAMGGELNLLSRGALGGETTLNVTAENCSTARK